MSRNTKRGNQNRDSFLSDSLDDIIMDCSPPGSQKFSKQVQNAADKLSADEFSRKVSELVRFLIMNDRKKIPIKKQDINKFVMKEHAKAFPSVFEKAKAQLSDVFGLEITEAETAGKSKMYMLINKLNCDDNDDIDTWNEDSNREGLLMIILSLIYMSDGVVTEALLWRTLKQIGLQKERPHKDFGDIDKILQDFIKKMYITKEKLANAEGTSFQYKWGLRSNIETTKKKVLQFVSEIYGVDIESWKIQYREIMEEEKKK